MFTFFQVREANRQWQQRRWTSLQPHTHCSACIVVALFQAIVNSSALGELRATTNKPYYVPGELTTTCLGTDMRVRTNPAAC